MRRNIRNTTETDIVGLQPWIAVMVLLIIVLTRSEQPIRYGCNPALSVSVVLTSRKIDLFFFTKFISLAVYIYVTEIIKIKFERAYIMLS